MKQKIQKVHHSNQRIRMIEPQARWDAKVKGNKRPLPPLPSFPDAPPHAAAADRQLPPQEAVGRPVGGGDLQAPGAGLSPSRGPKAVTPPGVEPTAPSRPTSDKPPLPIKSKEIRSSVLR